MNKWLLSLALVCSSVLGYAQIPGLATTIQSGTALPSGAKTNAIFLLTGSNTGQLYICVHSPSCTLTSHWVVGGSLQVINNQANTISTGLQDFSATDLRQPLHSSDPGSCVVGQIEFNTTGTVMKVCSATNTWTAVGSGTGTVTSVGLTLPVALFTVSGSPVTGSGSLSAAFASVGPHLFLGNNTGGSATAGLFQLACADLSNSVASCSTDATNATNIGSGTLNAARLPAVVVLTNQANTFSTGLQNFSSADLLQPNHPSDPGTCSVGQIEFNTTAASMKVCTATNTWTTLGAAGSLSWSSLSNGGSGLSITPGGASIFNTTTAVSQFFAFKNTTVATISASQSSPNFAICGTEFHAAASAEGCLNLQFVPGTGTDAANVIALTHTGSATGVTTFTTPGPMQAGSAGGAGGVWDGPEGTTASCSAGHDCVYGDSTLHQLKSIFNGGSAFAVPQVIGQGTSAMATGAITSGTCASAVTTAVSGAATTDNLVANATVDPTGVTGYAVSASGGLYIQGYLTSGNVNFKVCNNTSGSLTPSALTLQWRVIRGG